MHGYRIPVGKSVKFLGLTFDSRLTWVPHLKSLKSKCSKRLNLLRAVSGTGWGADRTSMLRFYKAYVRSCLDYGCQVYSSAKPTALKMLDPIHNSALRLATGAFRSSPVASLLAESGEPPLSVRRTQLNSNYYFTLKSKPDVPTHKLVFSNQLSDMYLDRPNAPSCFGVRVEMELAGLDIRRFRVRQFHFPDVPPWRVAAFSTNLSLAKYSKHNTPDVVFVNGLRELLHNLGPCDVVYTDGSRSDIGTGCAFVTNIREYMFRLPPEASVYTAELTAILKALRIVCPRTRRLVICTDSLSSVISLQDMYSKNGLVVEIFCAIDSLVHQGVQVTVAWIPGHVGIKGNELADRAAKAALELQHCTGHVPPSDLKRPLREFSLRRWNETWTDTQNNKLRVVKDSTRPWGTAFRESRREEVVLCRLRIGHTRLTHGFLMTRGDPPMCVVCDEPLTVQHILISCIQYSRFRRTCRLPSTLREVLEDEEASVCRLLEFLRRCQLTKEI